MCWNEDESLFHALVFLNADVLDHEGVEDTSNRWREIEDLFFNSNQATSYFMFNVPRQRVASFHKFFPVDVALLIL